MIPAAEHLQALIPDLLTICRQAGDAIKAVYLSGEDIAVTRKSDDSPVTQADHAAHQVIAEGLEALTTGWPILSEEERIPDFATRQSWPCYWLVDPLDGTKEFIARTDEFTINIALIHEHYPCLGIIYVPMEGRAYIGIEGLDAWLEGPDGRQPLQVAKLNQAIAPRMLTSSRHRGEKLGQFIDQLAQSFGEPEWINAGSALKFCRLAEGKGDIYPRFTPCCEWDTAAGQAVLEAAGGQLLGMDFQRFSYNRRDSLINPHFYAVADSDIDWPAILAPV